jgi:hypothetical protein
MSYLNTEALNVGDEVGIRFGSYSNDNKLSRGVVSKVTTKTLHVKRLTGPERFVGKSEVYARGTGRRWGDGDSFYSRNEIVNADTIEEHNARVDRNEKARERVEVLRGYSKKIENVTRYIDRSRSAVVTDETLAKVEALISAYEGIDFLNEEGDDNNV